MDLYRLEFHPTQYPWHYANPNRDNEGTHGWRTEKIQKREFENAFDMWNENHSLVSDDHLYFIKAGVNIKIGRSINVAQRLTQLKTGIAEEPQILHIEENKGCIENNLHKIFEDTRVRKDCEWFRESKHLNEFILYLSCGGKNF